MFEIQRARLAKMIAPAIGGVKSFLNPSFDELGIFEAENPRIPEAKFGNYEKYLQAFADEGWIYACVNRIAHDVATAPIFLYADQDKKTKVDKHPVLDLLRRPNKFMNRYQLIKWTQYTLDLAGNQYWKLDGFLGAKPRMIFPTIPSLVEIKPDPDPSIFIKSFDYHADGQVKHWKPEEVIHFKYLNPLNYYYGLAPLSAARLSVDTHRASSRWNLRFFDNSARPDIAFTTPHSLTPEQRQRMAAAWNNRHRGESNAHGAAFLEKGTTVEVVGVHQKDMDFVNQKKISREEICSIYGVPPALVGLFEYANYANADAQERMYWRNTVIPAVDQLCQFLNDFLLPLFDPSGRLTFALDQSGVRALQEDDEKRSKYIRYYWEMGVPMNTLIDAYNLPFKKPANGGLSYAPMNMVPSDAQGPIQAETPGGAGGGDGASGGPGQNGLRVKVIRIKQKDGSLKETKVVMPTDAMLKAKHHRHLILAETLGKGFKSVVRKHFDEQKDAVLSHLRASGTTHITAQSAGLTKASQKDKLGKLMLPGIKRAVHAGRDSEALLIDQVTGKLAVKPSEKAIDRVNKWSEKKAFQWAGDITDTTLEKIDKVIQDSLESGASVDDLAKDLAEAFDTMKDYRTERIAQTEMIASLNEGALEAYRENDQVAGKGWLATYDEATRETHAAAGDEYGDDAGAIEVNADFKVGGGAGPAPGQIGLPEEDINCRCAVFPVVLAGGQ